MASPPTCLECGSILMGFDWDKELNFPVYFCLSCREEEEAAKRAAAEAA
ncbi:MAG: hypothetical protein ACE5G5_02635 [Candidatus Methylomirabilales bacterium]